MAFTTMASTLLALLLAFSQVAESKHYRSHDPVHVVANTIGPFNNPTETYPVRFCWVIKLDLFNLSLLFILTVQFYSLPFCTKTGRQVPHKQDLGETLSGSHKITTPYDVTFLDPVPWRSLCEEYLSTVEVNCVWQALFSTAAVTCLFPPQLKEFKDAIEDDFFFEMLIDDLPVWGYIGEVRRIDHSVGDTNRRF